MFDPSDYPGGCPRFYPARYAVQVRYADLDAMNHVNNAAYVTFLEVARTAMWQEHIRSAESARDFPFIVARITVNYKAPIRYGDHVEVQLAATHVGQKSFTLEYQVDAGERMAAEAETVQVYYDYAIQQSVPIPEEIRRRLGKLSFLPVR